MLASVVILAFFVAASAMPGIARADADETQITAASSPLTAQSAVCSITSPNDKEVYGIDEEITVSAKVDIYFFWQGWAVDNFITFRVTKNGDEVAYSSQEYTSVGAFYYSFTPEGAGTYKIEVDAGNFSVPDRSEFIADDSIKVKVSAANFKQTAPMVTTNRYKQKRVKLSWDNDCTYAKVFRSTSMRGKYKLVKKTTKKSYTDKVKAGTHYFYKVRLYLTVNSKTYASKFSDIQLAYGKLPDMPVIKKLTKTKKGVKVKWVTTDDPYMQFILRATKKNGEYKVVGYNDGSGYSYGIDENGYATKARGKDSKTAHFFNDWTAKKGKTYYYKIESKNPLDYSDEYFTMSKPMKIKA